MGSHFLLQGIFPTQGWNLSPLQWQADSSPLSHLGGPQPPASYFILQVHCDFWMHYPSDVGQSPAPDLWQGVDCLMNGGDTKLLEDSPQTTSSFLSSWAWPFLLLLLVTPPLHLTFHYSRLCSGISSSRKLPPPTLILVCVRCPYFSLI